MPSGPQDQPVLDVEKFPGLRVDLGFVALQPQHLGRRIHAVQRGRAIGEADRTQQLEQAVAVKRREAAHHLARDARRPLVEPDHARPDRPALAVDGHHAAHLRGKHDARRALAQVRADLRQLHQRQSQREPPVERILLSSPRSGIGDGIGVVGGVEDVEIRPDQPHLEAARPDVHRNDQVLFHNAPETD